MLVQLSREARCLSCVLFVVAAIATGCSSLGHSSDGSASAKPSDAEEIRDAAAVTSDLDEALVTPKDAANGEALDAIPDLVVSADVAARDAARAELPSSDRALADLPLGDAPRTDVALGDSGHAEVASTDTVTEAGSMICPWGDQQIHDTTYGAATTLRICLVTSTPSKLRYHVTIPSTPAAGGYVVVSFRKVSQYIQIGVGIVPDRTSYALDNSLSASYLGKDYDTWFAAAAGAGFFIDVSNAWSSFATITQDFEMSATLVPVVDPYEPNESQPSAATMTVGTSITASAFAGYGSSASPVDLDLSDFYKITLPAGLPTVTLTGASPGFSLELGFQDPRSQSFSFAAFGETGANGSVSISPSGPMAAGDYYVFVQADYAYRGYGSGTAPPSYLIQSYNLLVTSESLHDAAPPEASSDGPQSDTTE
jgi:hypothetical protein